MAVSRSLWRIGKETAHYTAADMSGAGAAAAGGRWNSKGHYVVYASTTIALAALETLAHLDEVAARNRFLIEIKVPISVWRKRQHATNLPKTWVAEPPGKATMEYGDTWLDRKASALLMVPSVMIHEEYNVLINPAHPDAKKITATVNRQFVYDPRLK